jgi:hypothetical protein
MVASRPAFIVIVALVLGASFAIPAEDVPETAYDESESLPCERTPVFSITVSESVAEAPAAQICRFRIRCNSLRGSGAKRLERRTGWAYPICGSLTILDHSFRC